MRSSIRATTMIAASALVFSSVGATTATAAPAEPTPAAAEAGAEEPAPAIDRELSDSELAEADRASEELFEELLNEKDGTWTVNEEAVKDSDVSQDELQAVANALNSSPREASPQGQTRAASDYGQCVLDKVGFGALAGAAAGGGPSLKYLVLTKNWKEVAWVIGKLVGVNAIKGGVAGLAVSLAAAGAWCATPWAG